jgi:hypothetical protein
MAPISRDFERRPLDFRLNLSILGRMIYQGVNFVNLKIAKKYFLFNFLKIVPK